MGRSVVGVTMSTRVPGSVGAGVSRRCRTVGTAILELLADRGVDVAFGLPGVHNLAFWSADSPVRIVGVRHEQACAYAADGYARATGRLGVALTTTGPGAANALAAFGGAADSGAPVLLISSDVSTALRSPEGPRGILHEMHDQAAPFAALGRPARTVASADEALSAVAEAVGIAMSAPRGPVYVGIPSDILSSAYSGPLPAQVDQAAQTLGNPIDKPITGALGRTSLDGRTQHQLVRAPDGRLRLRSTLLPEAAGLLGVRKLLDALEVTLLDAGPHLAILDDDGAVLASWPVDERGTATITPAEVAHLEPTTRPAVTGRAGAWKPVRRRANDLLDPRAAAPLPQLDQPDVDRPLLRLPWSREAALLVRIFAVDEDDS